MNGREEGGLWKGRESGIAWDGDWGEEELGIMWEEERWEGGMRNGGVV